MNPPGMPGRLIALVLTSLLIVPGSDALAQWDPPDELQAAVDGLSDEQSSFITSGTILDYIPERQLEHELRTRESNSLASFVDDLMSLHDQMAYDPEEDMGAIPLNLTSENFRSVGLQTPELLRDFDRAPGPFSVHRYLYPKSGVPTFGGAKVAIFPEDLVAGDVDVAIVGVPSNMSSGRRDAGWGPHAMRAMDTIATPDIQSLIMPLQALSVVDYGNFDIDNLSVEKTIDHVTEMVAETSATGAVPMIVGGDTSMLFPGVKGVAETQGYGSFGLLHFSAHPDAERFADHTMSDHQAFFRLLDQDIVDGDEAIQVGLRGPAVDVDTLQWLRDQGVRYHTMAEIQARGFDAVLRRVLREVDRGPDTFFVSIDVSAIDPTDLIAAGRAATNGLRLGQVTHMIRQVCASKDIVGFEITDLAVYLDFSKRSIMHANAVLNACLNGIAVRRSGLDADFVHPLALDHGQR